MADSSNGGVHPELAASDTGGHNTAAGVEAAEQPIPQPRTEISDDINDLKKKILELEARQADNGAASRSTAAADPQVAANIEQYKRMEACLYKHRKEWELKTKINKSDCDISGHYRGFNNDENSEYWFMGFRDLVTYPKYERPDVFDPSHNCEPRVQTQTPQVETDVKDEYDTVIDWGNRRDRVRKHFEWQMDRLFLDEEIQKRRDAQVKSAEIKKRRERRLAEAGLTVNEGQEGEASAQTGSIYASPKLNWAEWYDFKKLSHVDEKESSMIDILIGVPIIDEDISGVQSWFGYSGRRVNRDVAQSTGQQPFDPMEPSKLPLPERIRIHSDVLLRIFSTIYGNQGKLLLELENMTAVFIRPYKALVYREEALRDWCAALEEKLSSASTVALTKTQDDIALADEKLGDVKAPISKEEAQGDNKTAERTGSGTKVDESPKDHTHGKENENQDSDEGGDENDPTKSATALAHLKCLLEFIDSSVTSKRSYLQGPQCRKVFFSDLWHLFHPGLEVIERSGKQAYKVIGVSSAKHRIARPWERWYAEDPRNPQNKQPDFIVRCVYIDFDGKNIGPMEKSFDFKQFDGERDVTSFEVYPLRLHAPVRRSDYSDSEWRELEGVPDNEKFRQKLVLRGAKFLEVAGVKHMYYAGPTLEAKDEVESPVVIDFETAFTLRDDPTPFRPPNDPYISAQDRQSAEREYYQRQWKPALTTLVGDSGVDDDSAALEDKVCSGECCRDEYVYDDQYVDTKQSREYIDSLLPTAGSLDEQPPITIMPRPLKELQTGPGNIAICPDDELVIMSYRVFGFVLRSRKWAKLDLSHLSEINALKATSKPVTADNRNESKEKNTNPSLTLNRLVLEKGHHSMIVSLIAQHFRDKKSITGQREEFDLVKGKGKGLIILLHGAPGVGKTSTAEGVAEMFEKPLFQITCGDLGTTATEVETALEMNFSLANKWDCILLLDEADVFLAERTKEDFKRNGLVAVFLRLMEYYSGILFLTTNRVGDFDEAFTSRIHVSLYYPELNEDKTVKVFKLNMDMIEDRFATKGRVVKIDRMEIGSFAGKYFAEHPHARWNGRQIRNACQTALALAEFEAQDQSSQDTDSADVVVNLRVEHFEVVRNAYLEFTKYMHDLYGSTSARRAKESRLRAIWVDENDRIVKTQDMGGSIMDKKNAFLMASQKPMGHSPGHSPSQSYQQPSYPQNFAGYQQNNPQMQQQQNYYQNQMQNQQFGAQQPQYGNTQPGHVQGTPYPANQNWNTQGSSNAVFTPAPQDSGAQFQGAMQQVGPLPQARQQQLQQQQNPANPQWLNENIRNMYAEPNKQGN